MRRVRVKGLVREANRFRQALSAPMTAAQRDTLAKDLNASLRQTDSILTRHNMLPRNLPGPSRRAYEFLRQINFDNVRLIDTPDATDPPSGTRPESVTYRGLRAFLDRVLDDVALALAKGRLNPAATRRVIRQTAERLDYAMRRDGFRAEHLKPASRHLAGWFRYFAEEDAFNRYVEAVRRAQSILGGLPAARLAWQPPLLVHYRPSSHVYRWRVFHDGTRIVLLTPMIVFDTATIQHLGRQMLGRKRHWPAITAAMLAEPYQAVAVELEAAAGIVERTRGVAHDLAEIFDRVNRVYFNSQLARPRLNWTRTLTGTTFGHYDFVHDRLCISGTLDQADVPTFVLDHVMHHELLHKKHGFRWRGARQHTHTRQFRAEERTFPQYEKAARFLNQLSADPCRTLECPDNG